MSDQENSAAHDQGRTDENRSRKLRRICMAIAGLAAAIAFIVSSAPAYACLFGLPC